MTAIVMNTLTGAVSEYDWAFASISPTRAGSDDGLFTLGGADDAGSAIAANFATGVTLCGASTKKSVPTAFVSARGPKGSTGRLSVANRTESWAYRMRIGEPGESRVEPGRGISEPYLGFGYANEGGADFSIDRIEVNVMASQQRRTSK
jgi:hypothetical protein